MRFPGLHHRGRRMARLESDANRIIGEQASGWVEIMKDPGPAERVAFARWLKKHPQHASEYLVMEGLDRALTGIDPQRRHSVEGGLDSARHLGVSTLVSRNAGSNPRSAMGRWRTAALAATLAATAIVSWWLSPWSEREWQNLSTTIGEQRVVELQDGSTVHLNTQSRLRLRFSEKSRDLELLSGEALFKVARNPTAPFLVHAGGTTIRAIGTQFNVHRQSEGTQVAVLEGKVAVSVANGPNPAQPPTLLIAGEEADVRPHEAVSKRAATDLARTVAWQQRRLVFRMDTLASIAAEFNRYNRLPQVQVQGDSLMSRRLSGVFDADDPETFARILERDPRLKVDRDESRIVIHDAGQ